MNRRLAHPLLAAAALLVAACAWPAYVTSPISAPSNVSYDRRLVGPWHGFAELEDDLRMVWLIHFSEIRDDPSTHLRAFLSMQIIASPEDPDNAGTSMAFFAGEAFASELDSRRYYNARITSGGFLKFSEDPGFIESGSARIKEAYWIFVANVDANDRLWLRALSDHLLLRTKSHKAHCDADCNIDVYELSSQELTDLIRSGPHEELFNISIGPFARLSEATPMIKIEPKPETLK